MAEWKIVYNDGTTITSASSKKGEQWNQVSSINVQFVLIYKCGSRHVVFGQDTYNIEENGANPKDGSLVSDAEFNKTRDFMIYGDY